MRQPSLLLLPLLLAACSTSPAKPGPFIQGRTLNIAHQGGEGLWPSNTMLAYKNAVALGVDMLEMDMHATRDGVLVLSHDETLDRLTNVKGRIADLPIAELLKADAGFVLDPQSNRVYPFRGQGVQVAQVRDVLTTFPNTPMIIEIKQATPSIAAPFCKLLRDTNMTGKVIVASFSDAALNDFRTTCPGVKTSMTARELRPIVLLGKIGLAGLVSVPESVAAVQVPVRAEGLEVVTPAFIRAMHARGIAVQVWTINDEAEMRRLVQMGVDGIITDYPDVLKKVLSETR